MKDNIKIGLGITVISIVFSYLFTRFALQDASRTMDLVFTIAFLLFTIAYIRYSKADKDSFVNTGKFLSEVNDRDINDKKSALWSMAFGGIFNIVIYLIMLLF